MVVLELAAAHGDDSRTRDLCLAPHELRALVFEPAGMPGVVASVRDLVAPPQDPFDVDLAGDRLGRARSAARRGERLRGAKQCLRRKTRVVGALASCEPTFDDGDLDVGVEPPQCADEVLAAGTRAEHHDASCVTHRNVPGTRLGSDPTGLTPNGEGGI